MRYIINSIRVIIGSIVVAYLMSSCVPNRKIQMMQKNDVNSDTNPKDSVFRTYALDTFHYKLQPNDIIFMQVRAITDKEFDFFNISTTPAGGGNAALNRQYIGDLIDENGEISVAVVGKVKVAGLTIFEAQEKLRGIVEQYIESPVVKIRLINFRITLLGEVNREGTVDLNDNRVSMLEAIAQGGGLGELADRSNVKLIRQKGGLTEIAYLNLLTEDFFHSPYYYVNQNDILVVPPLKQRPFRRYFGQNLALIVSSISLLLLTVNIIQQNN